jgi:hypothetical protein
MKKSLLFAIIVLSINASAQSKHPTSPSMETVRGRIEKTGIKTSDIAAKMNLGQVFKHKAPNQGSLIQVIDSTFWWQWDTLSTGWKIYSKGIDYLYDSKNNLTSILWQSWNGTTWVNSYKNLCTYDANNNLTSELDQNWNGSGWVNSHIHLSTYDANNNLTNNLYQTWNGSGWVNSHKYLSTYNANNYLTNELDQDWNGSVWVNTDQYTYSYNVNNNFTSELSQTWNGTTWVNTTQYTYTYDADNNRISGLIQGWVGNGWVNSFQYTYSYNANNKVTSGLCQIWNNSAWVNSNLSTYSYDANNNRTSESDQTWNGTTWVNSTQYTSTYDASNFEKSYSRKNWDSSGAKITDGDSSYYYYHTVLGIYEFTSNFNTLKIYPNPAKDNITLELSEAIKESNLAIIDIDGQQLITRQITSPKTQLDISALPSGVYFVRLTSEKSVLTGKFIKQ